MIKGNPLKLMLQFAFPLLLGNLLQQTYNIIDAAIVGQILGAKALASVGASISIQFLVLGFCMGSCTGFGVPVAKYFGAAKIEKMRDYIFKDGVFFQNPRRVLCGAAPAGSAVCRNMPLPECEPGKQPQQGPGRAEAATPETRPGALQHDEDKPECAYKP